MIPTLNEFISANRTSPYKGADMKKRADAYIRKWLPSQKIEHRCIFHFRWYESKKNRDPDNIASAKKYILDAMQEAGILENDGWKQVAGFTDEFYVSDNPRVEIETEEIL